MLGREVTMALGKHVDGSWCPSALVAVKFAKQRAWQPAWRSMGNVQQAPNLQAFKSLDFLSPRTCNHQSIALKLVSSVTWVWAQCLASVQMAHHIHSCLACSSCLLQLGSAWGGWKFTIFSNHNGSLLRRQPRALEIFFSLCMLWSMWNALRLTGSCRSWRWGSQLSYCP